MTEQLKQPRKPIFAFLLSILTPGLGHIYNGRLKTGILLFSVSQILLPYLYYWTHLVYSFYGLVSILIIEITFRMYIIISAIYISSRQKDYILKTYNKSSTMTLIGASMLLIAFLFSEKDRLGIKTFSIPTTSNDPTLKVNDKLVSDINYYKYNSVNYGDIVTYKISNGETWVFRVVGLPFDTISIVDNVVSINHKVCKTTFIKDNISEEFEVKEFEETLPNGHRHTIFKFITPFNDAMNNIADTIVPSNHYYLLGDNRDNAADSRFYGFINKEDITGRIIYSYWGQTRDRINIDFIDK